ncbi:7181_t:CDS:2 [Entrophospora sp. SA101]|nr:7181_t:CDS:2 [Entrophospora sp. SA101]
MSNTNNSNAPNVGDSNAPSVSDLNTNNTNNSTSFKQEPSRPKSFKQKSSSPKSSKTDRKNKKDSFDSSTTYNPSLEDDDYNVDNGRDLENLSREKLEWDEENDDNDYANSGKRQDMLDQM